MAKKNPLGKIKVSYNAPVTLTFSLLAILILFLNGLFKNSIIPFVFTSAGAASSSMPFNLKNALDYFRLVLHVFGHSDWLHLISNLSFVLLLGPIIENRYGSPILIVMMVVSALVSGVVVACFSSVPMLGADDIAFMMILLASFSSVSKNEIPLSFILILILYVGKEFTGHSSQQNIATIAHIAGGFCGSLFALLASPKSKQRSSASEEKTKSTPIWKRSSLNKKAPTEEDTTVVGSIEL